jgi:hypothetical protein
MLYLLNLEHASMAVQRDMRGCSLTSLQVKWRQHWEKSHVVSFYGEKGKHRVSKLGTKATDSS